MENASKKYEFEDEGFVQECLSAFDESILEVDKSDRLTYII